MIDPAALSPPALTEGQRIELTISDLAFGGEGVGRWHDFVVFVPFVLTGEVVEAAITEVKKRFARARLVRIIQPSPGRVAPPCPYFTACGGCQYQHIAYAEQLALKSKQLGDLFERLGGLARSVIEPIVPCPEQYGYRNRIMIRSQWDKYKRGLNIGFLRADSRLVIDIEECRISSAPLNQMIREVRAHPPPKGGIKMLLREPVPGWEVPRDSFFQNNFLLLPALVEATRRAAGAGPERVLVDAYCGVGFFSIHLASLFQSVVGLEFDHRAVQAARRNAEARQLDRIEFQTGRVEALFPEVMRRFQPEKTVVLVDPPRTGCSPEFLELILQHRPREIIYISCHPATLARDLKALCEIGRYEVARVTPLDMFPQTQHLECVTRLSRDIALPSPEP